MNAASEEPLLAETSSQPSAETEKRSEGCWAKRAVIKRGTIKDPSHAQDIMFFIDSVMESSVVEDVAHTHTDAHITSYSIKNDSLFQTVQQQKQQRVSAHNIRMYEEGRGKIKNSSR